jgi:hypothetical protein
MDNILELTYRTPQKPLRFGDVSLCWMCGKKLGDLSPVWMAKFGDMRLYYCSIACKKEHKNLKSDWKP